MESMMLRSRASTGAAAFLWCFIVLFTFFDVVHAFSSTNAAVRCSLNTKAIGSASSGGSSWSPVLPTIQPHHRQHSLRPIFPGERPSWRHYPLTLQSSSNSNAESDDKLFDVRTTVALVGGQSLLIVAAVIAARFTGTPNIGLGPGFDASFPFLVRGILWSLPLGLLAVVLDVVENRSVALQEVTKATQSSVLSLLGGTFKPLVGTVTALALGAAAGIGEEMLFRGVMQFELGSKLGSEVLAVGITSVVFGALHAVTPLYAGLASLASVFFGWLYLATGNLMVPIVTHAFYDWAALLYAHWTVANMSADEQQALIDWRFGGEE
mmetsp:Transcript_24289/g.57191  ORF Transcript_24289/g.57191 Transcript_24289/m.57191 type:complete len:323 (+) Transcript_24289:143-1111(+)